MSDSARPAPVPDEASMPFFEGAKRRELMIQRCKTCGAHLYPTKLRCDICLDSDIEWVKASGKGQIYTFA
ncbi:MAG: zinc ribbon domain-containing protein, partial [Dehalococcoidia bacterium]|nr:zinc ribbon domain-containing protein [Dehalococcoidia bacterium]